MTSIDLSNNYPRSVDRRELQIYPRPSATEYPRARHYYIKLSRISSIDRFSPRERFYWHGSRFCIYLRSVSRATAPEIDFPVDPEHRFG